MKPDEKLIYKTLCCFFNFYLREKTLALAIFQISLGSAPLWWDKNVGRKKDLS